MNQDNRNSFSDRIPEKPPAGMVGAAKGRISGAPPTAPVPGRPPKKPSRLRVIIPAAVVVVALVVGAVVFLPRILNSTPAASNSADPAAGNTPGGQPTPGSTASGGGSAFSSGGGAAYSSSTGFSQTGVLPTPEGSLLFLNYGAMAYTLESGQLTRYLPTEQMAPHYPLNTGGLVLDGAAFWLNGSVLMKSPLDSPERVEKIQGLSIHAITHDGSNIYLLDEKGQTLYTVNPATLEYTERAVPTGGKVTDESASRGIMVYDGRLYFREQQDGRYIWFDLSTEETGEMPASPPEGGTQQLCVDGDGFYFCNMEGIYRIPHGSDKPELVLALNDSRLVPAQDKWRQKSLSVLCADDGWLYFAAPSYPIDTRYSFYRVRTDGSKLMGIRLPGSMAEYYWDSVSVHNGWISTATGACRIEGDVITGVVSQSGNGHAYEAAETPLDDLTK